ncbi:ABC transporter ATP-binding protein [uncultured Enterovirga sp.]|uniref:ABC transporter ATP-binding protein n=1 Tax=uncultured Enterovirga sp. TaxID=2026352 RepID=UPI0035C94BB4
MSTGAFQSSLRIEHLSKHYGAVAALDDVSLTVEAGEFLTLLGPSGSGKTTLLMSTAGFVEPSAGTIRLDGQPILHLPPERRHFGMVFQGYALFPHLTVARNVAFPLEVRGRDQATVEREVRAALDLVQLGHLAGRFPRQLSGGQQQRVALARALVFEPHLLLLDEPLSALDRKLRLEVQIELKILHRKVGRTFVYVTHDQDEALSMSDRIAIMRDGRIVQHGTPQDLYEHPRTRFVADFLGRSNFLEGHVEGRSAAEIAYRCGASRFVQAIRSGDVEAAAAGDAVTVSLRPEKIRLLAEGEHAPNVAAGRLASWSYFGTQFHLVAQVDGLGDVALTVPAGRGQAPPDLDSEIRLGWDAHAGTIVANDRAAEATTNLAEVA